MAGDAELLGLLRQRHRQIGAVRVVAQLAAAIHRLVLKLGIGECGAHFLVAGQAHVRTDGVEQVLKSRGVGGMARVAGPLRHRAVQKLPVARHVVVAAPAEFLGAVLHDEGLRGPAVGIVAAEALAVGHRLVHHRHLGDVKLVAERAQFGLLALDGKGVLLGIGEGVAASAIVRGDGRMHDRRGLDGRVTLRGDAAAGRDRSPRISCHFSGILNYVLQHVLWIDYLTLN